MAQDIENKDPVSRFRPHCDAANREIGSRAGEAMTAEDRKRPSPITFGVNELGRNGISGNQSLAREAWEYSQSVGPWFESRRRYIFQ